MWRWRESVSPPMAWQQSCCGCSLLRFSRPQRSRRQVADGLSHLGVPAAPVTRAASSGSLADARIRVESLPGLTDFEARSGGEGEVGALGIGTYWFAEVVIEMTLHPRPASSGTTTVVETDHPLLSCPRRPQPAGPSYGPTGRSSGLFPAAGSYFFLRDPSSTRPRPMPRSHTSLARLVPSEVGRMPCSSVKIGRPHG